MCTLQAACDQPLAEHEEADASGIFLGEFGQGSAARVAPLLGPLSPVEALTVRSASLLNRFKAAVIFQGFTAGVTEAAEVGMQRMFALHKAFVQRLQQPVLGFGGGGPVDQRQLFKMLEFDRQSGGVDGSTQRALAENRSWRAIQAVEEQAAGRRIRAIAPGVAGEHRVQRTDRQRFGTALTRHPRQIL
ncbi:hypothetical protein D3C71_1164240 [compost metagenome]